jgi:hypothetical protein
MIDVKLSAEDFKNLHNGKCELFHAVQQLDGVLNDSLLERLRSGLRLVDAGLASAYQQEQTADEIRHAAIDAARKDKGFKTEWSMDNFDFAATVDPKPKQVLYRNHWGSMPVRVGVKGDTWLDMWAAADTAIRNSGDDHHIFIEGLRHIGKGVYELDTGS